MTDENQDVKSTETPAPEPQEQVELSDEQVEGIAGGISSEPVYSQAGVPLTSKLGGLINPATVLTVHGQVLAGK